MAYRLGIDIGIGTTDTIASVAVDGAPVQLVSLGARSQQTHLAVFPADGPSPGQDPPGQDPPGPGEPGSPGYPPGAPPTQAYGAGGLGGPGGYPPGPGGEGSGGFRGKLASIIAGTLVLVGVAVGVGFLISGRGEPRSTTASPSISPSVSPAGQSPTASASPSSSPSASGSPTSSPAQRLPSAAAIPESEVIVPMRFDGGPDRPLYLVDTEGKIKQVELPTPEGGNSNPIMQASRNTIIYLNAGKLRVMAADGSGDRELFNRDPAGCANVAHASWNLTDPNVILITCQLSKNRFGLLVVGMDGKLIRRLDAEKTKIGDAGISPDGRTVLYWASDNPNLEGGGIYTLPMIGTGNPKQLTDSADGVDADPAWSPDGNQIAFRRKVQNPGGGTNEDIFVMNADGTAVRAVATTPAADFKPIWSPDSKNLLIVSNRESAFGGPGSTFDLWLTRVSDGKVLTNLDLKAGQITRPFWTQR
jgi:WD40-like Beta Propeller Repeat